MVAAALVLILQQGEPLTSTSRTFNVAGKSISAQVITVDLSRVRMKVALAENKVGRTEELASMAKRHGAIAAINGSFFEAYTNHPIKSPNHTLITGGRFAHIGTVGTTIALDKSGRGRIERRLWTISGSREGAGTRGGRWFAYWLNRWPTGRTVTVFTRDWGDHTGALPDGSSVTVEDGIVKSIGGPSQRIPENGFVIYFRDAESSLLNGFRVGQTAGYNILPKNEGSDWSDVQEAVGAGPLLVRNGRVELNSAKEGFRDPKILSASGVRSAVALTASGKLLLVATSGTIPQVAEVMRSLGADAAMNLDGGASSGLWARGSYVRKPGRLISNALLVLPK
jgi:hypothetical protein